MKRLYFETFLMILCLVSLTTSGIEEKITSITIENSSLVLYEDLITLPSQFHDRLLYDEMQPFYKVEDGLIPHFTAVDLYFGFNKRNSATLIFDEDGKLVGGLYGIRGTNLMLDSRTLVMANTTHAIFWNLVTNETEYSTFIDFHHAFDYNPVTDTFLVLGHNFTGTVEVAGENFTIDHDTISEIDRDGNIIWHWNGAEHLPFDRDFFYLTNLTDEGYTADWTHGNSVYWDIAENSIYYNARHLSTVFKIDKETKEIIWQIGALNSDFTMYNVKGQKIDALFYGAHDIQYIGNNHFTIYDNDYLNLTNLTSKHTRYVEFAIDENTWEAREVWTWNAPISHWTMSRGGVDKLPGGNFIGVNGGEGLGPVKNVTEVNQLGEIVWEVGINNSVLHRSESFFASPVIQIDNSSLVIPKNQNTTINLTVWNSFKNRIPENAKLKIYLEEQLLTSLDFSFLPDWQETELSIDIPSDDFRRGTHSLSISVENLDGLLTIMNLDVKVSKVVSANLMITMGTAILASIIIRKKRRK